MDHFHSRDFVLSSQENVMFNMNTHQSLAELNDSALRLSKRNINNKLATISPSISEGALCFGCLLYKTVNLCTERAIKDELMLQHLLNIESVGCDRLKASLLQSSNAFFYRKGGSFSSLHV